MWSYTAKLVRIPAVISILLACSSHLQASDPSYERVQSNRQDELSVAFEPNTKHVTLDVYDRFMFAEREPKHLARAAEFIVVDGARATFGTCADVKRNKISVRPSVLRIEHQRNERTASWDVLVSRRTSFDPEDINSRDYAFSLSGTDGRVVLEPGIVVSLKGNQLNYTQTGGIIGPFKRNSLRITYKLGNSDRAIDGRVSIDEDSWSFWVDPDSATATVNGVSGAISVATPQIAALEAAPKDGDSVRAAVRSYPEHIFGEDISEVNWSVGRSASVIATDRIAYNCNDGMRCVGVIDCDFGSGSSICRCRMFAPLEGTCFTF